MVILGVDPGLAHTGWGVIETKGGLCRARAYGCIATDSGDTIDHRLGSIFSQIKEVVDSYNPTDLAIEELFFGQNSSAAIPTAEARGAAICACLGLIVGEYTPKKIKQSVCGTGAADKHQVGYMVAQILDLDHVPSPDHASDALACAICHAHTIRSTRVVARGGLQ